MGMTLLMKMNVAYVDGFDQTQRPKRRDVVVTFPPVSPGAPGVAPVVYDGELVSPSALDSYELCQRKWGFGAIDGIRHESKAALFGTDRHSELDLWLTKGTPPKHPLLVNSGALTRFPAPFVPGMRTENVFAFLLEAEYNGAQSSVCFWGFKDVELGNTVYDLKTTSDFKWAKTEAELKDDTQGCIYALDNILGRERDGQKADSAVCQWNYVRTKGKALSKAVRAEITKAHATEILLKKLGYGERIVSIKQAHRLGQIKTAKELSPDGRKPGACGAFGGCGHLGLCTDLGGGTSFHEAMKQERLARERASTVGVGGGAGADGTQVGPTIILLSSRTTEQTKQPAQSRQLELETTTMASSILERAKQSATKMDPAKAAALNAAIAKAEAAPQIPVQTAASTSAPVPAPVPAATGGIAGGIAARAAAAKVAKGPVPAPAAATPAPAPAPASAAPAPAPAPASAAPALGVLESTICMENVPTGAGSTPVILGQRADGVWEARKATDSSFVRSATSKSGALLVMQAALNPPPPPPVEVAAEPKKRGRPKGSVAASTEHANGNGASEAFSLYIDVLAVEGQQLPSVEDLIVDARQQVELDNGGQSYRLIEFGKGAAYLGAQLEANFKDDPPKGSYYVHGKVVDKEVIDVLIRQARTSGGRVFKGVF